jgi:hypothetical protein
LLIGAVDWGTAQAAERRRLLQQQNSERASHKEQRLKLIYQVEALMRQVWPSASLAISLQPIAAPLPPRAETIGAALPRTQVNALDLKLEAAEVAAEGHAAAGIDRGASEPAPAAMKSGEGEADHAAAAAPSAV